VRGVFAHPRNKNIPKWRKWAVQRHIAGSAQPGQPNWPLDYRTTWVEVAAVLGVTAVHMNGAESGRIHRVGRIAVRTAVQPGLGWCTVVLARM
jgi:hypothetical protein